MTSQTSSLETNQSSAAKALRPILEFVKRHRNEILLVISIILVLLAAFLVFLLVTQTFAHIFTCNHLIDETLNPEQKPNAISLCTGVDITIGPYLLFPGLSIGPYSIFGVGIGPFSINSWTLGPITYDITPALNVIDPPLEAIRKFISWNIVIFFAVASLVVAYVVIKVKGFIEMLLTPQGRNVILTNLTLFLFFFAVFCALFYFVVVARAAR